ncbi:MAG: hypothetical protein IT306_12695 [Chloroflexi bacterium]|nr:hypothetical protein [Chloroflexota bacterium]
MLVQSQGGPRPFDVATRFLIDDDPEAWLACAGLPIDGPSHVIESDVSTVLAQVDKVVWVDAPEPWLAHLELQASRDRVLPLRLLQYHALLRHRHEMPVATVVVLLRPQADGPEVTGRLDCPGPRGEVTVSFSFEVVRIWERSVDDLLAGGIGTLPLAPLADVEWSRLPEVIRRIDERLTAEVPTTVANQLWTAVHLLLGLRYDAQETQELLQGITNMRESSTYQAILEEGREEGEVRSLRRMVLELGADRFGPPDASITSLIEHIGDLGVLNRLLHAILRVNDWQELRDLARRS